MDLYVGVDNRIHSNDGTESGWCGTSRWTAVASIVDLVDRSVCETCAKAMRHRQAAAASHGQDRYDGATGEIKADKW